MTTDTPRHEDTVDLDERDLDEERERAYDRDDRVRCTCVHLDLGARPGQRGPQNVETQCLVLTRHPSGKCADCRVWPRGD